MAVESQEKTGQRTTATKTSGTNLSHEKPLEPLRIFLVDLATIKKASVLKATYTGKEVSRERSDDRETRRVPWL